MRITLVSFLLTLCCALNGAAQEKPIVDLSPNRQDIELRFGSGKGLPATFAQITSKDLSNYTLYELEPLDRAGEVDADRTHLLDAWTNPECIGSDCQRIRLHLTKPLVPNQTYIMAVRKFTDRGDAVTVRFDVKPVGVTPEKAVIAKGPDAYHQRSQLTLKSKVPIEVDPQVEVHRLFYRLKPDYSGYVEDSTMIAASVDRKTDQLFVLNLDGKLAQGQDLSLFISDGIRLKGVPGALVRAEGPIKLVGTPTKPEEIRLDMTLSSVAAVKQKPVFDLTAKFIPTRIYQVGNTNWVWEPTFAVDVGLRSTKSANSIVLAPLNFSNYFGENWRAFQAGKQRRNPPVLQPKYRDGTKIPTYANWMSTPWYRPSDVKFTLGPKVEFDRNLGRKNVLGSFRFDFDFHRWRASMSDKRRILASDFGDDVSKSFRINYGWSTVPYVSFDLGRHINDETVTNTKKKVSEVIPSHNIFRTYFGFVSTFESNRFYLPLTITIDESVFYLADSETIGLVTDSGVGLRKLHGFQHRDKTTFSFALDPSKHYNFNLSYENGRLAPNFEYLNKLSAGLRLVFW